MVAGRRSQQPHPDHMAQRTIPIRDFRGPIHSPRQAHTRACNGPQLLHQPATAALTPYSRRRFKQERAHRALLLSLLLLRKLLEDACLAGGSCALSVASVPRSFVRLLLRECRRNLLEERAADSTVAVGWSTNVAERLLRLLRLLRADRMGRMGLTGTSTSRGRASGSVFRDDFDCPRSFDLDLPAVQEQQTGVGMIDMPACAMAHGLCLGVWTKPSQSTWYILEPRLPQPCDHWRDKYTAQ